MGGCCYSGKSNSSRGEYEDKNTLTSDPNLQKQETIKSNKRKELNRVALDEISEKEQSDEEYDLVDRSQDYKSYTYKTERSDKKFGSNDDITSHGEKTYKTPKFGKELGSVRSYSNTLGDFTNDCNY